MAGFCARRRGSGIIPPSIELDPTGRLRGAGDLRIEVAVRSGRLGAAVLWRGSGAEFVVPEVTAEAGVAPLELLIRLPEISEVGHLVFRSWVEGETVARIISISLHRPSW